MDDKLVQLKEILQNESERLLHKYGKLNNRSETLNWAVAQIEKLQAEA